MAALRDVLLVFLLASELFLLLSALCPPGWKNWQQSCYAMYTEPMNWADAAKFCDTKESHLVVPNSQAENGFLWEMAKERYETVDKIRGIWVGCRRQSVGSSFVCSGSAEEFSFNNWAPDYPQQGAPLCVVLSKDGEGKWVTTDTCARHRKYFICEMPIAARVHDTSRMRCMTADANGRFVTD